jgi:ABC-2 type transport system ATP-binding protein
MRIQFQSVTKRYFGHTALDRVTTEIPSGAVVAVLGVNGAGKSTLLKCLSTQVRCTRGDILIDGQPLLRMNIDQRRRLHFLPDQLYMIPHIDPVAYVGTALDAYECSDDSTVERVGQLFKEFSLLGLEYKPMATLSRGQQYKTALSAMIAMNRELWLLDERFASGMDPLGINAFKRHARVATQCGHTVIYTTQILEIVESFADHVLILNSGRLVACGALDEIRDQASGSQSLQEFFDQFRPE